MKNIISTLFISILLLSSANSAALKVAGNFTKNVKHVAIEKAYFESINANYNPMDVIGIKAPDALRLIKAGTFDVMSVQIGMASRDEPLFEGIDLIGVSTDMVKLKKAVESYRGVFDQWLQEKFNAKVMTLWPFGPQMFYCNAEIKGVNDLKGLKIRSFTPSMSAMLEYFGATPVTLGFSEVYPALQKGVVSCGVTSPTSANTGKWMEVTTHFMPLSVSGAVQGHFMNLDSWNKLSSSEQAKLEKGFKKLENDLWDLANTVNDDAMRCIAGEEPCKKHTKYNLKRVALSDSDTAKVKEAALKVVLPTWKKTCNNVDKNCTDTWNKTVGKVAGMTIK